MEWIKLFSSNMHVTHELVKISNDKAYIYQINK